tara:strand:- start:606 stop:1889 length:1284 start_codon:yes stop_codon:yes gene_type:complete
MSLNKTRKRVRIGDNEKNESGRNNRKTMKNNDDFNVVFSKDEFKLYRQIIDNKKYKKNELKLILVLKYKHKNQVKYIRNKNYNDRNPNTELSLYDLVKVGGSHGIIISINQYRKLRTKELYNKYCVQFISNWKNNETPMIKEYTQRQIKKLYYKYYQIPFNKNTLLNKIITNKEDDDDDDDDDDDRDDKNIKSIEKQIKNMGDNEKDKRIKKRIMREIETYVKKNRLIGYNQEFYTRELDKKSRKKLWKRNNIIKYNIDDIDLSSLPNQTELDDKNEEYEKENKKNKKDKTTICEIGRHIIKMDVTYDLVFGDKLITDERGKIVNDPLVDFKLGMAKKFEELSGKFDNYCNNKKGAIKEILNGIGNDVEKKIKESGVNVCKTNKSNKNNNQKGGKKCYPLYKRNSRRKPRRNRKQGKKNKITRKKRK